jgi:hypothetical protein
MRTRVRKASALFIRQAQSNRSAGTADSDSRRADRTLMVLRGERRQEYSKRCRRAGRVSFAGMDGIPNRAGKPKIEMPFEVPVGGFDNAQFQAEE